MNYKLKKLLSVFTSLVMIITISSSLADSSSLDLSQYDTEKLLSLRKDIDNFLFENKGYISLPNGYYLAGRDIAPGSYTISFFRNHYSASDVTVIVYKSSEAMATYDSLSKNYQDRMNIVIEATRKASSIDGKNSEKDLTIPVEMPEPIDGAQFYTMRYDRYLFAGENVHFSIEEGQVLFITCNADYLSAVIEKSPTLFID